MCDEFMLHSIILLKLECLLELTIPNLATVKQCQVECFFLNIFVTQLIITKCHHKHIHASGLSINPKRSNIRGCSILLCR